MISHITCCRIRSFDWQMERGFCVLRKHLASSAHRKPCFLSFFFFFFNCSPEELQKENSPKESVLNFLSEV